MILTFIAAGGTLQRLGCAALITTTATQRGQVRQGSSHTQRLAAFLCTRKQCIQISLSTLHISAAQARHGQERARIGHMALRRLPILFDAGHTCFQRGIGPCGVRLHGLREQSITAVAWIHRRGLTPYIHSLCILVAQRGAACTSGELHTHDSWCITTQRQHSLLAFQRTPHRGVCGTHGIAHFGSSTKTTTLQALLQLAQGIQRCFAAASFAQLDAVGYTRFACLQVSTQGLVQPLAHRIRILGGQTLVGHAQRSEPHIAAQLRMRFPTLIDRTNRAQTAQIHEQSFHGFATQLQQPSQLSIF